MTYRLLAILFALVASSPAVLAAQAPVITPEGDPSVANDTIYALAVDSADYPDEATIVLLDDGVVRYEADGTGTQTFRQVVQILKEDAVDGFEEHSFSWAPGHQNLTVNWIRVVKPDGEVISVEPSQLQDSDIPATMGNPVYSDRKVRRASLTGVAVGTIVDFSYTTEELKPFLSGDFFQPWAITMGIPARRSRLIVDVPVTLEPRILERNLDFERKETVSDGRRVYVWAANDVAKAEGEAFAADSDGVRMSVTVSSPTTWQDIAGWYHGLSHDRYELTPEVREEVVGLLTDAVTRDDTIRAVHRWVAQDIRYVSISLGLGGYQPRTPAEVLKTGFGDCKDKATMFIAALREFDITAYPVLLNSSGGVERALPSIEQFDHAIAAVKEKSGYTFVDLTSELTPYGELPYPEQGEFAIVVLPDGSAAEVMLPEDPITANRSEMRLAGALDSDGTFDGHYMETAVGAAQYGLRDMFSTPMDSTERANVMRYLATNIYDGARGDSLRGFAGKDLGTTPRMTMLVLDGKAARTSGDIRILDLPMESMSGFSNLATRMEAQKQRRFPIDAETVAGGSVGVTEIRITLPAGWHARLPQGVTAKSDFGNYESSYAQKGNELIITRRMAGSRGVLPPDRIDDLIAWFRAVGEDDVEFIVLEGSPTANR
ncbi:MAG: DUF3857 domain-containing transglutaminase family protein [Gemmatimonadaceae bacterium]